MELADQLRVEDAELAVEGQRPRGQPRYRGGDFRKTRGVIATAAADEADAAAVLKRDDAPAGAFSS